MKIEELVDLVLSQQDRIDKLIGQNMALRTALLALITTHHEPKAFAERFDRIKETATVKSLYAVAQDVSLNEADKFLDELARPWRKP
jgi:hypothetical protein